MTHEAAQTQQQTPTSHPLTSGGILQRKCASCGQHLAGTNCKSCSQAKLNGTRTTNASKIGQHLSQIPVNSKNSTFIQPKLVIGQPRDKYEQEADQVADEVMRMPDSHQATSSRIAGREGSVALPKISSIGERLQQQIINAEEEIQAKKQTDSRARLLLQRQVETDETEEEEEEVQTVQAKTASGLSSVSQTSFESRLAASQGNGQALPKQTRRFMESRFGHDFSQVKVHTDSQASQLNRDLGAKAFTHSQNIYFGASNYHPDSSDGKRLIAHELTHVIQQEIGGTNQPNIYAQRGDPEPDFITTVTVTAHGVDFERHGNSLHLEVLWWAIRDQLGLPRRQLREGEIPPQFSNPILNTNILVRRLEAWTGIRMLSHSRARLLASPPLELTQSDQYTYATELSEEQLRTWFGPQRWQMFLDGNLPERPAQEVSEGVAEGSEGEGSEGEGSEGEGSERALTPEGQEILAEVAPIAEELEVPVEEEPGDNQALVELLREIENEEERRRFLREFFEFFKEINEQESESESEGSEHTTLAEALRQFRDLSPAEREILRTNRELRDDESDSPEAFDEQTRVTLQLDAEQNQQTVGQVNDLNQLLSQIDQTITDEETRQQLEDAGGISPFPAEFNLFLNEIVMFKGLLAGASRRSAEIRQVSGQLLIEINALIGRIREELNWLLAEQAAITVLIIATEGLATPAALLWVRRLNRLRRLIERAQTAFAVYEQIRSIIETVRSARTAYTEFRQDIDNRLERLRSLQEQLEDLEAPESLEIEIERLEAEITSSFEAQMGEGGNLSQLLESFYIPPETSNEELFKILANIPNGLDDLDSMINLYQQIEDSDDPQNTVRLGAIAVRAGARLYPLVGFMAGKIGEALPQILPERTPQERLTRFVERAGSRLSGRRRRERTQGIFARLRGSRFEYDQADLRRHLAWGEGRLLAILREDEPSGHWTRLWFRYSLRQRIRELNREARTRRTRGRPRRTRRRRRATAAPWQRVPLPPFRIRIPLIQGPGRLRVILRLNPNENLTVDRLTMRDFGGSGMPYVASNERRKRSIRSYLAERDYEFIEQGRHIRLRGTRAGHRLRPYLQIDGNNIKKDNRLAITRSHISRFLGRRISQASRLPEGYYLQNRGGVARVRKKRGVRRRLPQLGFGSGGRLETGAEGGRRLERLRSRGRALLPPQMESFNYTQSVDNMFVNRTQASSGINIQGHNRAWWRQHIERNPQLQQRPSSISGRLGYVRGARLFGDRLSSKALPEMKRTDDKGHLIAKQFDGNDAYYNLIPMDSNLNQRGRWRRFERAISENFEEIPNTRNIEISITVRYPDRSSRRPSSFSVEWIEVGGGNPPTSHRVGRISNS